MLNAVKGMNDIYPAASEDFLDTSIWEYISQRAERVFKSFGFNQIWLPIVEETTLFQRSIGDTTDIVSKEMYSFTDRGERQLTLRPEGTAGAVRAYITHALAKQDPLRRWFYLGPMFRAERPQKGRYRQFYQLGAELFGVDNPAANLEMLMLVYELCQSLELTGLTLHLNSLGDQESKQRYSEALKNFFGAHQDNLCPHCLTRLALNPLRILDCKQPACKSLRETAPDILTYLSPTATNRLRELEKNLTKLKMPYVLDKELVRGLDYYTEIIFEYTTTMLGAQDAILGGGRYDNLVSSLGGPPTPAIGFAAGIERLALLVAKHQYESITKAASLALYIMPLDPLGLETALTLRQQLYQEQQKLNSDKPLAMEIDLSQQRLKAMLKRADRLQAKYALILGENERQTGQAKLKNLQTGIETPIDLTATATILSLITKIGS